MLRTGFGLGDNVVKRWDLPYHLFDKYRWYFRYRCALLQIQEPKKYHELTLYRLTPTQVQIADHRAKDIQDKITSLKAQITTIKNKMAQAKAAWTSFLPIESDPLWMKAAAKLAAKECELDKALAATDPQAPSQAEPPTPTLRGGELKKNPTEASR